VFSCVIIDARVPASPLFVLNISPDSILHVSASDTAVRYSLLHGLPPLLTILLLTKFAKYKLIVILPLSSITELSIRPLSCTATRDRNIAVSPPEVKPYTWYDKVVVSFNDIFLDTMQVKSYPSENYGQ
jgi:hypothetical protein